MNLKIWASAMLILLSASACEDFLDINENPNTPTTVEVELVLPQAIVATAGMSSAFNSYGGHFGGYIANAGGFSGFGTLLTYGLAPGDYNGLWTSTYLGPLNDLKYVIDNTEDKPEYIFHNAAAKIMTVVNYQRLVDAFGDVAFSQALDPENANPAYDDAAEIYGHLIEMLDEAIALIDSPGAFTLELSSASDPLFGKILDDEDADAQMLAWKRYANTLKLRMFIRTGNGAAITAMDHTFKEHLDGTGADVSAFITEDVIVNPGYELNRPSQLWAAWGRTTTGAVANASRIPTTYSYTFFTTKINDADRGELIFSNYPSAPNNQLGNEINSPSIVTNTPPWTGNQSGLTGLGVFKGPAMGVPLMLLAESKFLIAEAQLNGDLTGDYVTTFNEGIEASFEYLYEDETGAISPAYSAAMPANYITNNSGNYLVDIEAAADDDEALEAIITQKYIALLMTNSDEGWNEYRRTGYPATVPGGSASQDIASNKSILTTPDRLPTRIMYPSSEQTLNAGNYRNVDYTSERIFWDLD